MHKNYSIKLNDIGIKKLDFSEPINSIWAPSPDNFFVEEIESDISLSINEQGNFLCFKLKKKLLSTIEAINVLSKFLQIKEKRFRYYGIKDKRATTIQTVCIFDPAKRVEKRLKSFRHKNIEIFDFERRDKSISIGKHYGNRFTIKLPRVSTATLDRFIDFATNYGIRNYYGPQHFGKNAINIKISYLIIKGFIGIAMQLLKENNIIENSSADYSLEILKRKAFFLLIIQAFQKFLFNLLLSQQSLSVKEMLPLPGYDILEYDTAKKKELLELLDNYNLDYHEFYLPSLPKFSMKTTFREARFFPEEMHYFYQGEDLYLTFILRRGSYASVLMAELTGGKICY
jgi:tRNA pseudouridine13 synthase